MQGGRIDESQSPWWFVPTVTSRCFCVIAEEEGQRLTDMVTHGGIIFAGHTGASGEQAASRSEGFGHPGFI